MPRAAVWTVCWSEHCTDRWVV